MRTGITLLLLFVAASVNAQADTSARALDSVRIISYLNQNIVRPLPILQGTYLFSGKKSETIELAQIPAEISNKTGRQIFAKVPGVFVYDMDGAGNQVNIAARGLDPHRGWEFNIRKDGIITNSDMYGYPASHFSMPIESIARIELVRGTGSLQYGAQFGGMLNYVSKQGDSTRPINFETVNTVGSFNLLSSYNAIGGSYGKFRYYAYFQKKSRDGFRDIDHTDSEAQGVTINYQMSPGFSIRGEWARSKYIYRIPGPLTDSMFYEDPKQASRTRNYFSPDIHVPSISFNWKISSNTLLFFQSSAVLGIRNSVQFDKPTNIRDTINLTTHEYNNRQVDKDAFNSYTTEFRVAQHYNLFARTSTLITGIQYMNNDLHRRQLGKGTRGSDYDMTLVDGLWGRNVHLKTRNIAVFAENKFQLTDRLAVNAGTRIEIGETRMSGVIIYYPDNEIPLSIKHSFPLAGLNFSYKAGNTIEFYGGWAQAYHPMLFKDLIPGSVFEKVDPKIKDSRGYNGEFGMRGTWKFLRWDVNAFALSYKNRFGTLAGTDTNGDFFIYRTNTGNSFSKGIEAFVQGDWLVLNKVSLSLFSSTAFIQARYTKAVVKSGSDNINIRGNKVESAPDLISRNGVSLRYRKLSVSVLYSYTSSTFADALNTVEPASATGAIGLVPSYGLLDMNFTYRLNKNLDVRINLNNVTNRNYFTKRPTFYPGPGVWPSDGRNGNLTFIIRI